MSNRLLSVVTVLFVCVSTGLFAASPVDRSRKLLRVPMEFKLADGPAWQYGPPGDYSRQLFVPDVKGEKLYQYNPKSGSTKVLLPQAGRISASFYSHGKLFLSENGKRRISRLEGKKIVPIATTEQNGKKKNDPSRRPNDLVVDVQGGIYYTLTRQGEVVYISPSGKQHVSVKNIKTPNGIILSPDGKTLYVAAYTPKEIWAYNVKEKGGVSGGRLFAKMDDGKEKGADGMTVDRAGNIYCAGPKHIWIWSPGGKLLDKIEVPTRPINCTFGGMRLETLFITGMGGLYQQKMIIKGVAPNVPTALHSRFESRYFRYPSTFLPKTIEAHLNVVYATYGDRKILADIFVPKAKTKLLPAIVLVHGGAWMNGGKDRFRAFAIKLAQKGYVTCAIEYRLSKEARFPAAVQDCNASVRFLRAHAKEYNIDPQRIGAVGSSAGGQLVGLMATAPDVPEFQGKGGNAKVSSRVKAAIILAGPMQMATGLVAENSRKSPKFSAASIWLGKPIDKAPDLYKLADPYLHLSKKTPPILFLMGEFDRKDMNALARKKMKELGITTGLITYPKGRHGFWNLLPWLDLVVVDIDLFFQKEL
ncbi:hypothetical protein MNBD_PLANCTO02-3396 [hydrothermal vent metagenome]|uniref:Gluconolactonase n=1 Tax=hydrothermal vent metagenome TaxID=652676 RepID=A0A3B1E497_9ZZZZ